jgi:hypothetical protein
MHATEMIEISMPLKGAYIYELCYEKSLKQ